MTVDFAFFALTALAALALLWAATDAVRIIERQLERVRDWCER
jgi:hypothetical protein